MIKPCPVCSEKNSKPFFSVTDQPVLIGTLWPTAEEARSCVKGDISLRFCPDCGFVWNELFDPSKFEYSQLYDNSLHFSPTFQDYSEALSDRLIDTYGIRNKTVVDIGCGKGDFLIMLCTKGNNRGYGFDPSFEGDRPETDLGDRITWSNAYFQPEHLKLRADLVASRFVFEHIPQPRDFLNMIRSSISDDAIVFFEVPDIDLIVRQGSVWDIIFEHCSYFSKESLSRVFHECGFQTLKLAETYEKQYVTIEARKAEQTNPFVSSGLDELARNVWAFSEGQDQKRKEWGEKLLGWKRDGREIVAWGAGAKAVGMFNMIEEAEVIERVIDINVHKQGKFLPGTGQRIIAPEELKNAPPDTVVLMNAVYRSEIETTLSELNLSPILVEA